MAKISATATDHSLTINTSHAEVGSATTSTTNSGSISGYGASKTISIPRVSTDKWGHVTSIINDSIDIKMPSVSDTRVNTTLNTTTKAYLLGTTATLSTAAPKGVTAIADTGVYLDTEAGTLVATKFKGSLNGNADSADHADSATTAEKLSSSAGSATKPVYFKEGKPTACTYELNKTVPSNAVFTDTDTKVTSAANHYAPSAKSSAALSVDASSTTSATWASTSLVTGVNLQRDAKGHVTGVTVDSIRMPSNPNTDTKVTAVGNHYTPSADSSAALSVDASSTTAATWNSTSLVTGVNLQRDAKGHVTGVTVDSIKMPANPDTDTHYTANLITGASATATENAAIPPNDPTASVYMNLVENGTVRNSHKIAGAGSIRVSTDSNGGININSSGTAISLNGTSKAGSTASIYAPTAAGTSGQVLKSNGSGEPTWVDGASLLAPKKITVVATAGQTSFSIPFEYDSLSSNLTVYFNGILMKETDNYTVDTTNNTVNLAGFSAEAGDIVTIMGLLGAQSIDFGQEAIDAINEINTAVDNAKSELQAAVDQASADIDNLVKQLPSGWDDYLNKNANNVMNSGSKITMASNYTPSGNYDVTTKTYVDSAISTATSAIVTDIYKASSTAPSNTKLLWIDTGDSNILKYYNGSAWTPVVVAWG